MFIPHPIGVNCLPNSWLLLALEKRSSPRCVQLTVCERSLLFQDLSDKIRATTLISHHQQHRWPKQSRLLQPSSRCPASRKGTPCLLRSLGAASLFAPAGALWLVCRNHPDVSCHLAILPLNVRLIS